jgi:CheY-like chemotaxis protein
MRIIHKFTHVLNGTINITSTINKGTTFTITIPVKTVDNQRSVCAAEDCCCIEITYGEHVATPFDLSNLSILIAEDNDIMGSLILRMLKGCKKKLLLVKRGVDIIPNLQDTDIVLLDGNLLDGVHAEQVLEEMSHTDTLVRIVTISGRDIVVPANFKLPLVHCMKPFTERILLDSIQKVLTISFLQVNELEST